MRVRGWNRSFRYEQQSAHPTVTPGRIVLLRPHSSWVPGERCRPGKVERNSSWGVSPEVKGPAADGLTKLKKTAEKASLSFSPFPAIGNLPMYMPSHGQWVQNRSGVAVYKGFWKDCKEALSGSQDFCSSSSSTPPTLTVVPWVHSTPAAKSAPSISLVLEYGKVPASSPEPARNSYTTLPRRGEREGNRIRILTPLPYTSWRPGFSAPTNQPESDTAAPTCAF